MDSIYIIGAIGLTGIFTLTGICFYLMHQYNKLLFVSTYFEKQAKLYQSKYELLKHATENK